MSANYPPPQSPQGGQNPYAAGPPPQGAGYGQPQTQAPYGQPQAPYGQQPPQQWGGAPQQGGFNPAAYPPPAPVAARRDNVGLGILVGIAAALAAALAYGGILRALSNDDGSTHEFRLMAIAVGAIVGLAIGKAGGRNPALPILGMVLALFAVVFGELFGGALVISHYAATHGAPISVSDIFLHHFGDLLNTWKHDFNFLRFVYLAFAAAVSFGVATSAGQR